MNQISGQIDEFWNDILSRKPELIRAAFISLDTPSQKIVLDHLQAMASEAGWQPEQRRSARAAIKVLKSFQNQE